MNILVTGAAGFVGSNLVKKLLENPEIESVKGIDNFAYGRESNISPFYSHKKFSFQESDICDKASLGKFADSCDVLVHLASQKIPRYSSALRTLSENSTMTNHVIDVAKKNNAKLVFASTSDVYGKSKEIPFSEENDLLVGPTTVKRWAYALSKMYSEQLIIAHNQEFDLDYTIMRFFGSYGPNQNTTWWGGPQAVFIQNFLEGKGIELHGTGLQTRTFTYIEDTIQGVELCITHKNSTQEIFNIASEPNEEITIKDLAETIARLMDIKSPAIELIPYETFGKYEDVMRRVPDISKIKEKLGYQPKFNIEEGLKKTIQWQRSIL